MRKKRQARKAPLKKSICKIGRQDKIYDNKIVLRDKASSDKNSVQNKQNENNFIST